MSPLATPSSPNANRAAERLAEATEDRQRLLLRAAREHGLLAEPEEDHRYVVRDPQLPGIVQLTSTDSCSCPEHRLWGYCEHAALVRHLEDQPDAIRRGGNAATVMATGTIANGRLKLEHAGFWRLTTHQDGITLSFVPVPLGAGPAGPVGVLEIGLDEPFVDVVKRLGASKVPALASMFDLQVAHIEGAEVRDAIA